MLYLVKTKQVYVMFVLGVTGGIGSGKTAATDRFTHNGIEVVDADKIAHAIVGVGSPTLSEITSHFGSSILLIDGSLDRKSLRSIVFNDKKEKEWLEHCLHPIIREKTIEAIKQSRSAYTVLSAPLLLEKNLEFLTNQVLVIDCPEAMQIDRTCRRDNNSIEAIQKIMQQQLSRRERIAKADSVIVNDGSIDELNINIDQYHFSLLKDISSSIEPSDLKDNNTVL